MAQTHQTRTNRSKLTATVTLGIAVTGLLLGAPSGRSFAASHPLPAVHTNIVLFADKFDGANRIVTNEFAHWNPNSTCPYGSSMWDMTSGTIMVRNGIGYSGVPTMGTSALCDSRVATNSAVFRLTTKRSNFSNIKVSLYYKAVRHGGGGAKPSTHDGLHIWLGHQSEYALYAATIFRWDKNLVIKKKVPTAQAHCHTPSNGGCYYSLSPEKTSKLSSAGVWHHADVSYQVSGSKVMIRTYIDGKLVVVGVDDPVHGATYASGAVGIRGDNTEFYIKDFKVMSL